MIKVAQCWDDGVATDIRVIEICRKYNAKATFNLCPGRIPENTIPAGWLDPYYRGWSHFGFSGGGIGKKDLKDIYEGFQVASHCWKHEVAGSVPDDEFLKAAVDARNFLEDLFQRECKGFAWPCGVHTPETERMLAEAGFLYGRTVTYKADVTTNSNPLALDSNCHVLDTSFWDILDKARETGVFYFWGHSYELMDVPQLWKNYEMKIKALSEDPEVEWVDVVDLVPLCKGGSK